MTDKNNDSAAIEVSAEYDAFVRDNLKRNYAGHFLHGMFGMTGFRLINTPTFVPAYIHSVSGSDLWVGIATSLQQLGAIVSPIVGAAQIEHRPKVLRVAALMGTLMRLQLLALALSAWFFTGTPALVCALVFLFMFGLFTGPQRVAFQLLLAKVIPIALRGRLQAWRNMIGGVIAAAISYFAGSWLIAENVLGNGYATTFFVAFVLTSLGLIILQVVMREPAPPTLRQPMKFSSRLRELPALLRADTAFAWFIVARSFAIGSRICLPFISLYAARLLGLTAEEDPAAFGTMLAVLSIAFMGADTFSNLFWGYWSDRGGFRRTFIYALLLNLVGIAVLLTTASYPLVILAAVLVGGAQSGYFMAASNIVIEFGSREDTPMRMALTNTAEGAAGAAAPLIGAALAVGISYEATFVATFVTLLASLVLMLWKVDEPRHR